MKRLAILAGAMLLAGPVEAKVIIDIQASEGQASRMFSGSEAVTSRKPHSIVAVMEDDEPTKKRVAFSILTLNAGDTPYNFGPENIAMGAEGKPFAVLTYDQLVKEQKRRGFWKRMAGALAAGANSAGAANAGNSYGTVSVYGSGGYAHGTYNSYDAGAAQAAAAQANRDNQAMMERIRRNEEAAINSLGQNLQTTTVDPGNAFGGQVMIELPDDLRKVKEPTEAMLAVAVGGDVHLFKVIIKPAP